MSFNFGTIKHFGRDFLADMGVEFNGDLHSIDYTAEVGENGILCINDSCDITGDYYGDDWDKLLDSVGYKEFCKDMPVRKVTVRLEENEGALVTIEAFMVRPK